LTRTLDTPMDRSSSVGTRLLGRMAGLLFRASPGESMKRIE
jgi:hypothetical protein